LTNRTTKKNAKIVREEIESEVAKLYIKNNDEEKDNG
jgi:hypothetical protein